MKKLLHIGIVLPFLSSLFFFAPPTHALTTYFQDDFSNGINSQTPPQVDPTNYTSPNAFFYNIPDFTYDNTEGVWSNGGQSAGTVLKATSINQNNYCAGQALVRNGNDNRTYGAISINTTNQNDGYVFNADLHWDSGIIEELSIYQPNVGYLYINHTTPFNTSTNTHWLQVCNDSGTITAYLDGDELATVQHNGYSGGNVQFSLFYAPQSHIANWAITDTPTNSYPVTTQAPGLFTASNVQYDPITNELSFTGTNFTTPAVWYDSFGISSCNNESCNNDAGAFWGPSTYFSNYQQFTLNETEQFSTVLTFNSYRPSSGTVYLWVQTNALSRNYSQALNYDSIIASPTPTPPPTPIPTPTGPFAPVDGTWVEVGDMAVGRTTFAATRLHDGKVLIAGGERTDFDGPLIPYGEIYNPLTRAWSQAGSLTFPRSLPSSTMVTLQNGKALLAGGVDAGTFTSYTSAELYDPTTDTWSQTGSMNTPRGFFGMVMLSDGRVLAAGGKPGGSFTNSAEIYNPATGVWTPTGSMVTPRDDPSMIKLTDGRVLVAGGEVPGSTCDNKPEIFNPTTNTWSPAGTLPYRFQGHGQLTLLKDGRVFAAGGYCNQFGSNIGGSAIYNPATNTWTQTADVAQQPVGAAFLLEDGRVMARSGSPDGVTPPVHQIYDPATNTWEIVSTLPMGNKIRYISLANGDVLGVGQLIGDPNIPANVLPYSELFTNASGADIEVNVVNTPDPATPGTQVTLAFTVTNNGPLTATGVVLNTTLPTGPNVISITPSQGTCSGTTSLTCTIGSLATNASATVNVIIKPTASGVYTTTATVESGEDDPVMTNNTVSESTTVSSPSDLARVNVARQGQGKVTSNPVGINCSTTCVSYFNPGTQVTLTATPDTGWEFIRWEGACSGTVPTCVITTNGDAHARSVFRRQ